MKRITKISLAVLLALTVAVPVFAWGPGGGRGGMMSNYNNQNTENPGQYTRGNMMGGSNRTREYNNSNLTDDQVTRLNDLQKSFYDDTAELRDQMRAKSNELSTSLNSSEPDEDRVKTLQTEVNDLRARMSDARIDYSLEAKKISPENYSTRGTNQRMGGRGGMSSFGPGTCF